MDLLTSLVGSEQNRREAFPICREKIFMAHAAVTALPRVVAAAVIRYAEESAAVNGLRSERAPVDEFATVKGF